jgi:hypothetical protein
MRSLGPNKIDCWFPITGKFLRADRQVFFFDSRDIANQGFAIFPMKVRKYIIKV